MIAQPSEFTRRIGGAVVAATAADHLATQAAAGRARRRVQHPDGVGAVHADRAGRGAVGCRGPRLRDEDARVRGVGHGPDARPAMRFGPLGQRIGLVCEWAGIGRIIASSNSEGVTCSTRTTMGLR